MDGHAIASTPPDGRLLKARKKHTFFFLLLFITGLLVSDSRIAERSMMVLLLEWMALFLVVAGVFVRIYASVYIGGRKNETVVADGPFSVVRNPLYVGSFIAIVGIAFQTHSLIFGAVLIAAFLFYYPFVVRREEIFLHCKFGTAYEDYMRRTPRWIPDVSLWTTRDETPCRPGFVRRALLEGSVFFLAIPLLECLSLLRAEGWLPTLVILP